MCLRASEAPRLCSIVRFQLGAFYAIQTHTIYSETDYPNPVINLRLYSIHVIPLTASVPDTVPVQPLYPSTTPAKALSPL